MASKTFRCDGIVRQTGRPVSIAVCADDEEAAIKIANEHGVLVETAVPDANVLFCPFCYTILPSDVPLVGQTVVCPRCNAQVRMPDVTGRTAAIATGQMIFAILGLALAALLLIRGCLFWQLGNAM